MIKVCKNEKISVLNMIREGKLDAASLSTSNLVDEIILSMNKHHIFGCLGQSIQDKRADNTTIPFDLVWASAIAAKMKVHSSLSDIPFAITDHRTLAELGYSVYDQGGIYNGLMRESSLRFLIGKYTGNELFWAYKNTVQQQIVPMLDIRPNIHILDCTPLEVNLDNSNYECSDVGRNKRGEATRGYSLATIRGITHDTGIIEDVAMAPISLHDSVFGGDLLKRSKIFQTGDILINDRGFISRDILNYMKNERGVDTYVPLRCNMSAYRYAVKTAIESNVWHKHPNKNRPQQRIALVAGIGGWWQSDKLANDVEINACVVWDTKENNYFVFITTDTTKDAREIIKIYELRPEIEEDFRQLKEFWKIEDFKSTKMSFISFHIICVLFGYLFFQLYTMFPEGEIFSGKSLPVVLKNYIPKALGYVVLYAGAFFGIFTLVELMRIYAECGERIRPRLEEVIGLI